jgi:hypothetical protein
MRIPTRLVGSLAVSTLVGLGACSPTAPAPPGAEVVLPPADAPFDYQIGQPYTPHPETRVVSRDREVEPVPDAYNICYVNAFQARPHELSTWEAEHPDLLLRDGDGYVVDDEWDEAGLAPQGRTIGFDFAIVEGCNRWSECDALTATYGSLVFVVEYREDDVDAGGTRWPGLSIVQRDRDVTVPGSSSYRYAAC